MSIHTVDGQTPQFDFRHERIAAGTVGGEHVQTGTLLGQKVANIVYHQNPRITYDGLHQIVYNPFTNSGTTTLVGSASGGFAGYGSSASLVFDGSAIGVLGDLATDLGIVNIYIDGALTAGRLPISTGLDATQLPKPGDTTIHTSAFLKDTTHFPSSGNLLIGDEIIPYSGKTSNTFTGATITQYHYADETIYAWGSSFDLALTGDISANRVLYYNKFLPQGTHTIKVLVQTGSSGKSAMNLTGFITRQLLGASNIRMQTLTVKTSVTTDANGYVSAVIPIQVPDIVITGLLGHSQSNTETSSAAKLGKLGLNMSSPNTPVYYLSGADASTTFDLTITFSYLGESL